MPTKLGCKELPSGYSASEFKYRGRPANDQGDFGTDVGIADAVCVNQFGDANNNKYYHGGVVQSGDGRWWVYLEWGRVKGSGNSWNGSFTGQFFQFVQCSDETDARVFFRKQLTSKNTARLEQKSVGGKIIWAAKPGDDGYLVQRLATRTRGLPDAYTIKDSTGVAPAVTVTASATAPAAPTKTYQPQVIALAQALVGGTKDFARAASAATGIVPTLAAIEEVRNDCIPTAMKLLAKIGSDVNRQLADSGLRDLSKYVASIVPRPIPRSGDPMAVLLTSDNILAIQQDLDAFESALKSEDFTPSGGGAAPAGGYDPERALNAKLRWIDPNSDEGKWLSRTFLGMSNRRHSYISRDPRITNMFAVERPDRDSPFLQSVKRVATARKGAFSLRANLQPRRIDLGQHGDDYALANVILSIHGTRAVNVGPILQGNFKLPRQLSGVTITGANFGHGIYFATDWRKSYGYTGHGGAYYGGGGSIRGRGFFMFLTDMIMGDAYRAPSTGSWASPPNGKDSVFGVGGDPGHRLENDEHIIFDPSYQRIRYVVEGDL